MNSRDVAGLITAGVVVLGGLGWWVIMMYERYCEHEERMAEIKKKDQ